MTNRDPFQNINFTSKPNEHATRGHRGRYFGSAGPFLLQAAEEAKQALLSSALQALRNKFRGTPAEHRFRKRMGNQEVPNMEDEISSLAQEQVIKDAEFTIIEDE